MTRHRPPSTGSKLTHRSTQFCGITNLDTRYAVKRLPLLLLKKGALFLGSPLRFY